MSNRPSLTIANSRSFPLQGGLRSAWLIVLVLIAALAPTAMAQEKPDPTVVLVPESEWGLLSQKYARGVLLDYQKYLELRKKAAANQTARPKIEMAPVGLVIDQVVYAGTLIMDDRGVTPREVEWTITASITVLPQADPVEWIEWSQALAPLTIDRVTAVAPGQAVAEPAIALLGTNYRLRIALAGVGKHTVTIVGRTPVVPTNERYRLQLDVTEVPVATIQLALPPMLTVGSSEPVMRQTETNPLTQWIAAFGNRKTFSAIVQPKVEATQTRAAVLAADMTAIHDLQPGTLTSTYHVTLEVYQAPLTAARLQLPTEGTLKDVVAEGLQTWRFPNPRAEPRLLEVAFSKPVAEGQLARITVVVAQALPSTIQALQVPRLRLGDNVYRETGQTILLVAPEFTARVVPQAGFEVTAVPESIGVPPRAKAYAFRRFGPEPACDVTIQPTPTVLDVTLRQLWVLGDHLQELNAALDVKVVSGTAYSIWADLPDGFAVTAVESSLSAAGFSWSVLPAEGGAKPRIQFNLTSRLEAAPDQGPRRQASATFIVRLLRNQPMAAVIEAGRVVNLPVVRPVAAREARLFAGVAAGRHIVLTFSGPAKSAFESVDLDLLRGMEIDHPDLALGLHATTANAVAEITVSPRQSRLKASAVIMAIVGADLTTAIRLELEVADSPVTELAFELPEAVMAVDVQTLRRGKDTAGNEAVSYDKVPNRLNVAVFATGKRYTVRFETRVIGKRVLYLTIKQPIPPGKRIEVPWVAVPGSQFTLGLVGIEAEPGTEVQLAVNGVDKGLQPLDVAEFPVTEHPALSGRRQFQHAYKYFEPKWTLGFTTKRHTAADLLPALVNQVGIATVLDFSGKEWVLAEFALSWSGVQGVAVALPKSANGKDAELIAVMRYGTNDHNQKTWIGVRPQRQAGQLFVPLSPDSDSSDDPSQMTWLRVIYIRDGGNALGDVGTFAPEFPVLSLLDPARRIPVLRTTWTVHLPPGYELREVSGDLGEWKKRASDDSIMPTPIRAVGAAGNVLSKLSIAKDVTVTAQVAPRERAKSAATTTKPSDHAPAESKADLNLESADPTNRAQDLDFHSPMSPDASNALPRASRPVPEPSGQSGAAAKGMPPPASALTPGRVDREEASKAEGLTARLNQRDAPATGSSAAARPHGASVIGGLLRMSFDEQVDAIDMTTLEERLKQQGYTSLALTYSRPEDNLRVVGGSRQHSGLATLPSVRIVYQKAGIPFATRAVGFSAGFALLLLAALALRLPVIVSLLGLTVLLDFGRKFIGESALQLGDDAIVGVWIAAFTVLTARLLRWTSKKLNTPERPFDVTLPLPGKTPMLLATSAALLMLASVAQAQPQPAETLTPKGEAVVFAPYDPKTPETLERIDRVFVPYDQYVELYNAAFPNQPLKPVTDPKLPADVVVYGARYEMTLRDIDGQRREHSATARFRVNVLGAKTCVVPLGLNNAAVTSATFTPEAGGATVPADLQAIPGGYAVRLTGPLRGTIDVVMTLPHSEVNAHGSLELMTAPSPGNRLYFTVPSKWRPSVQLGGGTRKNADGSITLEAVLEPSAVVRIQYAPDSGAQGVGQLMFHVTLAHGIAIHRTWIDYASAAHLTITSGRLTELQFALPDRFTLKSVSGQKLRSWSLADNNTRLVLQFLEPIGGTYRLELHGELPAVAPTVAAPADGRIPPILVNGALYQHGRMAIAADDDLTLTITETVNISRSFGAQRGYEYTNPDFRLGYNVALKVPKIQAHVQALAGISAERSDLDALITLAVSDVALHGFDLELGDAQSWIVYDVTGDWLKEYREGDSQANPRRVRIEFTQPVLGQTQIKLRLRQTRVEHQETVSLPTVRVAGVLQSRFEMGVASVVDIAVHVEGPNGFDEISTRAFDGWPLEDASMRKRAAFRYSMQMPSAIKIHLSRLKPKVTLTTLTHVKVTDDWLAYGYFCRWQIDTAPVDRFVVIVPRWLSQHAADTTKSEDVGKDITVLGANIESISAEIRDPQWLSLTVKLHYPIGGHYELAIFPPLYRNPAALPSASETKIDLPVPVIRLFMKEILGQAALAEEHAVTIEHDSTRELEGIAPVAGRITPIQPNELNYLPQALQGLRPRFVYRLRDVVDSALHCATLQQREAGVQSATVSILGLTTLIGLDGELRHTLTAQLDNRSLQFLEIALPSGAELWRVRVNVRPVTPVIDQGGAKILVPVPMTRPGELPVQIEVVYATKAKHRLDALPSLSMVSPRLANIQIVGELIWTLLVPPELEAKVKFDDPSASPMRAALKSELPLQQAKVAVDRLAIVAERISKASPSGGMTLTEQELENCRALVNEIQQQATATSEALSHDESTIGRLRGTEQNKSREWLNTNRKEYEALQSRAQALLATVQKELGNTAPRTALSAEQAWLRDNESNVLKMNDATAAENPLVKSQQVWNERSRQEQQRQMAQGMDATAMASRKQAQLSKDLQGYQQSQEQQSRANPAFRGGLQLSDIRNDVEDVSITPKEALALMRRQAATDRGRGALAFDLSAPDDYTEIRLYQEAGNGATVVLELKPKRDSALPWTRLGAMVIALLSVALVAIVFQRWTPESSRWFRLVGAPAAISVGAIVTLACLAGEVLPAMVFLALGVGIELLNNRLRRKPA